MNLNELYEELSLLLADKKMALVKAKLTDLLPADIADFFEQISRENVLLVFRMLPKDLANEVFAFLEPDKQQIIIDAITDKELSVIVEELYIDDAVDMLEELPASVVKRVLKNAAPDTRKLINQFLNYPENSAGSIMTAEFVNLRPDMTVGDAISHIRKTGNDRETVYTCYVVTKSRELLGVCTVKDLLMAPDDKPVSEVMEDTEIIYVNTSTDQEEVALLFSKYGFLALPVVDNEKRLVGIVTVDDAIEVLEDEVTEDIEKMAAILPSEKSYLKTGIFETWKNRIPWLLLLMISATFTGAIISSFEAKLVAFPALTAFIPMLMDTGGNAGGQSSVTIIRSLAVGDVNLSDWFKIFLKELRVSILCGLTLGVCNFAKIMLVDRLIFKQSEITLTVALVISLTLLIAVIAAKIVGSCLPLMAKKVKLDPAVMASPFITTIVDAVALVAYFKIASTFLKI
ncbi:MAG: magnesium transporter [Clostridia bacterium]|nr:magnesium transporter [Clostridia bacterium]